MLETFGGLHAYGVVLSLHCPFQSKRINYYPVTISFYEEAETLH